MRWRVMMLCGVAALGVIQPVPAHAFLGKLLNSFFGGGGGEAGCFSETSDGLLGAAVSALAGAATGTGGDADGGRAGGCPIVESEPLTVERMVHKQELELIAQTAHMLTQIESLAAMRRLPPLDTGRDTAAGLSATRRSVELGDGLPWRADAVDAQFRRLYPDALPAETTAAGVTARAAEQASLARTASRASKRASADAMTGLEDYPARLSAVAAAAKACAGQTCVLDANTQVQLLNAEIGGRLLVLQAAHHRAVEAQQDHDQAAVERARQNTLISWRGLDAYGRPGS